mgnify:CR=1 FL=1
MSSDEQVSSQTFEESATEVANECVNLLISKQKDYGPENILSFGELGVLVRMNDKMARLKNILWKKKVENGDNDVEVNHESIEDTFKDMANYAMIALMLRRDQFELPLEADDQIDDPLNKDQ